MFNKLFDDVEQDRRERGSLFVSNLRTMVTKSNTATTEHGSTGGKMKPPKPKAKTSLKRSWTEIESIGDSSETVESGQNSTSTILPV
ncbi:MAG: hypothetical protein ACRC1D_09890 [Culicoidibacterales bacterium]